MKRVVVVIACVVAFVLLAVWLWWAMPKYHDAPTGCAWVDLDAGKSSDFRLACVDGYWPADQPEFQS